MKNNPQTGRLTLPVNPGKAADKAYQLSEVKRRELAKLEVEKQTGRPVKIIKCAFYRFDNPRYEVAFIYLDWTADGKNDAAKPESKKTGGALPLHIKHFGKTYDLDDSFKTGAVSDQMIENQRGEYAERGFKAMFKKFKDAGQTGVYIHKK
tara:strand:+ start:325 stop:777 length:453 start_codon:yes stop_codon:yes gene_type:complete